MDDDEVTWAMSTYLYVKWAIAKWEPSLKRSTRLSKARYWLHSPPRTQPLQWGGFQESNDFQGIIAVLWWVIEIGWIDIILMLSWYLVNPWLRRPFKCLSASTHTTNQPLLWITWPRSLMNQDSPNMTGPSISLMHTSWCCQMPSSSSDDQFLTDLLESQRVRDSFTLS